MPGSTMTRVICVIVVVVALAVGTVALVMPSGGSSASDPTNTPLPGSSGDATQRVGGDPAQWVVDENAKPGTADWVVKGPINNGNIEGFADTTSTTQGSSVRLFVSTDSTGYVVEAYRMGYYGGLQGRLVWHSGELPGSRQALPTIDPSTRMVQANWRPSLTLNVDSTWPPGDYLVKLVADNGFQQFIPLAVRDDSSQAGLVVLNAVTTWQAYNKWGGHSLYEGQAVKGANFTAEQRSQVVSFDRPYINDSGAGDFLGNELPLVTLVESLGIDVTYMTDVDLHVHPERLANHKALLSLGHDEYWSLEMRQGVEKARNNGMNVAFFGANALYRSIRLAPSAMGPARQEINYRVARNDPLDGVDNSRVTVSWREPPLNKPESSLVGTYYECNPVKADLVVADSSAWVFAGTGLSSGDKLKNVVGPEYDRYDKFVPQPPGPVQILSHSPVKCHGRSSYSDMTYYSTPSGSAVFATGTNWWISRLGPSCPPKDCVDAKVVRITENVLRVFALGPAGQQHPSVNNTARILSGQTQTSSTATTIDQDTPDEGSATTAIARGAGPSSGGLTTPTDYVTIPFSVPATTRVTKP